MKPPIIINDSKTFERAGDLAVYRSVRRAEHAHELWAAEDRAISAFDSEGRLLKILPMQSEGGSGSSLRRRGRNISRCSQASFATF